MTAQDMSDFFELVQDFLDGAVSEVQRARLANLVQNPEYAREFIVQARVHNVLHARLGKNMANEAAIRIQAVIGQGTDTGAQRTVAGIVDSLSNDVSTQLLSPQSSDRPLQVEQKKSLMPRSAMRSWSTKARRRLRPAAGRPSGTWATWATLAAAALIVAVIGWRWLVPVPVQSGAGVAVVARITAGSARVFRPGVATTGVATTGEGFQVQAGDAIYAADSLETDGEATTWQWLPDSSVGTIQPHSRVMLDQSPTGHAAHFHLENGSIHVLAAPQQHDDPMVITTAFGSAQVVGTDFTVSGDKQGMFVQVEKGSVRLRALRGNAEVTVGAGEVGNIRTFWSVPCLLWTTTATPSDQVVAAFGVNLHLSYDDTSYSHFSDIVLPRLQELGARQISDGDGSERIREQVAALADRNIGIMWRLEIRDDRSPQDQLNLIHQLGKTPMAIMGVFHADQMTDFVFRGHRGVAAAIAYHNEFVSLVQADPLLREIPIYQPSFSQNIALQQQPQGWSNQELFPGDAMPEAVDWQSQVLNQAGYHTAVPNPRDPKSVNDRAVAYYAPRLWFTALAHGARAVYWYELLDWSNDPQVHWANYGVLHSDGTAKPVFTVLQRWLHLLADPGRAVATNLATNSATPSATVALGGDLSDIRHVLWSRSDGSSWLALWRARAVFDGVTRADIPDQETSVIVASEHPITQVDHYRPAASLVPRTLGKNVYEVSVPVGAEVTVLRVEGLYVQP